MSAPDPFLVVADMVITAVITAHAWGPWFLGLAVVATWWRLRPTGRHRDGRTRRTTADTGPDPAANTALTCTDTCPGVSTDTCPALPGHDDEGER